MRKFITAGAGSGKTYTVTTEVARKVKEEGLRPEQVIMTTFTKAAAQELREKAKRELVNIGLPHEAQQMEHALIGTVHSVANTFLTKYWYLLGIMPDACALEEDELNMFRNQSLRGLLSKEDRKFLYDYCERHEIPFSFREHKPGLNYEFWKSDIFKVLDYMQWYGITDEQLDKSLHETTESIVRLLQPKDGVEIDNPPTSLKETFNLVLDAVNSARKSQKKETQQKLLLSVDLMNLSLESIKILSEIIHDRKLIDDCSEFLEWANELMSFPLSACEDHRQYAEIIFRLAKKWRITYRQFKDDNHLIDFNDMEEMFLQLIGMDEVRDDISARFKILYVDEFQDSNPMQVRIFQKLSQLVDTCYVGDKKQAIYGFRGADTELTSAVADSVEVKDSLEHSYRSVEPLVNFSNVIFSEIFKGMNDIKLTMPEKNGNCTKVDKPIRLWQWENDRNLALQIQQFILREKIEYRDIAVLAKENERLDSLAQELRALEIPVCRENDDVNVSRTGRLMKALLTLIAMPGNMLARAEVAYLTEKGYNLSKIIEERLDNLSSAGNMDFLKEIPIIHRLLELRDIIKSHSVSAIVESMVIELNLYALVRQWNNANAEEVNLQVFVELAKKYEMNSQKMAHPATVAGFIDYFTNQNQKGAADNDGVCLFTYHKSKGLEWKVVVMLSLDEDSEDAVNIARRHVLGCHTHRDELPTPECPNPITSISLVRNIYTKSSRENFPSLVLSRLQQHPYWQTICDSYKREMARLLYVGVTRARNTLILAAHGKDDAINLSWFRSTGLNEVKNVLTEGNQQDVLGVGIPIDIERFEPEHLLSMPNSEQGRVVDIADGFSPLDNLRKLSPSRAGKDPHQLGKILNDMEQRIPECVAKNQEDYARMGDFIHQVFCCMDDKMDENAIRVLRNAYGFTDKHFPEPGKLIDSWHFLIEKLENTYGKSVRRMHELPFHHVDSDGHLVNGYIDFVWETQDAFIVIDYKTCASNYSYIFDPDSEHFAGRHGNQLDCYRRTLEDAGGKKVAACLIYYPVTGFLVEVL